MSKEQDIVEQGNKLIAVFMGAEIIAPIGNTNRCIKFPKETNELWVHAIGDLQYNWSWDWLHGAWEKFRGLKLSEVDEGFADNYSRHLEAVGTAIIHYPISKAFERLVSAIQWHNKKIE